MPTPNWGLPLLTGTEAMSFKGLYNAQSNALETGMDNLTKISGVPRVASAAARNALYPSPAQGNMVWRTDLQRLEGYYATYSSTTNTGGRQVAGWYPASSVVYGSSGSVTANPPAMFQPLIMTGQLSGTTQSGGAQNWAFPNGGFPNGLLSVQLTVVNGSAASSALFVPANSTKTTFQTFSPGAPSTAIQFSYLAIGW